MVGKGVKAEMTDIFVKNGLVPKPKHTTFDDCAVMSMVGKELSLAAGRFLDFLDYREDATAEQ